jgi:H2-forming N(5),N(10)-methenyltetrahydromethanopterin dehydrogenase-like protein
MKVAVYGAGNQDLYVKQLKLPEIFGGEPPFGGSRMAMEYAKAGHEVYLAEPNREMLNGDYWKAVERVGVRVTPDDTEAAKHAEIAVFFTPFGKPTFRIAKNIVKYLLKDGVIATTCTVSPLVLYYVLEREEGCGDYIPPSCRSPRNAAPRSLCHLGTGNQQCRDSNRSADPEMRCPC